MQRFFFLVLCVLGCKLGPSVVHAQPSRREQQIREVVQKYFNAYETKDVDSLMALWHSEAPGYADCKRHTAKLFAETGAIQLKALRIPYTKIKSKQARIEANVTLLGDSRKTRNPHPALGEIEKVFEFVRVGRAWKIWKCEEKYAYYRELYRGIPTREARIAFLRDDPELVPFLAKLMGGAAYYLALDGKLEEARQYSNRSLEVAEFSDSVEAKAWSQLCRGYIFLKSKEYTRALECYEKALLGFRREQQDTGEAITLGQLGWAYMELKQPTKAVQAFEKAQGMLRILPHTAIRDNLHPMGWYYFQQLDAKPRLELAILQDGFEGDFSKALESQEALCRVEAQLFGVSSPGVADCYQTKAFLLAWQEKFDRAFAALQNSDKINAQLYGPGHDRLISAKVNRRQIEQMKALKPADRKLYWKTVQAESEGQWLQQQHMLEEAVRVERGIGDVYRKLFGQQSTIYADSLVRLADYLEGQKKFDEAIALRSQSVQVFTKTYGGKHPRTSSVFDSLIQTCGEQIKHQYFVERNYKVVAATVKRFFALAKSHSNWKPSLHERWMARHFERLSTLQEEQYKKVAAALTIMARITVRGADFTYASQAEHEAALADVVRSHKTIAAILGEDDWGTSASWHHQYSLNGVLDRHKESRQALFACLAIYKRVGLENTKQYASRLGSAGSQLMYTGDLTNAGRFLEESLEIYAKTLGRHHPDALKVLRDLARWYDYLGQLDRAFEIYLEMAQAYKRHLQGRNPNEGDSKPMPTNERTVADLFRNIPLQYASTLVELAGLYRNTPHAADLGFADAEAERAVLQHASILRRARGETHVEYGMALVIVGEFYFRSDRLGLAEKYCLRAFDIVGKSSDGFSRRGFVARVLTLLGRIAHEKGDFALAEQAFRKAMVLYKESASPQAGRYRRVVGSLLGELQAQGKTEEALTYMNELFELDQRALADLFRFGSEQQMQTYFHNRSDINLSALYSLFDPATTLDADTVSTLWTWTLRRKGMLLDTLCRYREGQRVLASNPNLALVIDQLRQLQHRRTQLTVHPPQGISGEQRQRDLDKLQEQIAGIQQRLKQHLNDDQQAHLLPTRKPTLDDVQRKLPKGSALIEFVRYQPVDFRAPRGKMIAQPPRYVAFVLPAGANAKPQRFDLGEAEPIDKLTSALREKIAVYPRARAASSEKLLEAEFRETSSQLYGKLIAPMNKALGDSTTLILVPDGSLHQLPFSALVDGQGKYMVETYRCAYLSSARDLLRPKASVVGKGVVVFGDPDYDLGVPQRIEQTSTLRKEEPKLVQRGPLLKTRGQKWDRLEATATEAKAIDKLLREAGWKNVEVLLRQKALEERVKRVRSPQILHLGTHGEFVEKLTEEEHPRRHRELGTEARLAQSDNPLLRSYLVLAGGNTHQAKTKGEPRVDDGLLTAAEVALLQLQGTELVVLSACKSGLGDVRGSEGVYGLRRAFVYAGARTLVLTLFSVPSEASMNLMTAFYTQLAKGDSKLNALHKAQKLMIQTRRDKSGAAHPIFWAGYTLLGDSGPLTKSKP